MPWRATSARRAVHDRCVEFWRAHGFEVVEADSDPAQPFLCNQARNNAVRRAITDVVILADADTLPHDVGQIHVAIEHAAQGVVVWPFNSLRGVPDWAVSTGPVELVPVEDQPQGMGWSTALLVVSRATFWSVGGFDERFTPGALGFDDMSFTYTAMTLLKVVRVEGSAWWFDVACGPGDLRSDPTPANPNWSRCELYKSAAGDVAAMRALLGTRPEVPAAVASLGA